MYNLPVAVLLGAVLISGSIFYSTKQFISKGAGYQQGVVSAPTAQTQPPAQAQAQPADISKVKQSGQPSTGNPNAKVTIAYWFDYQCPFCKKFETDVMPKLMSDYVQTGKVRVVFKDFQFLGQDSQTAGLASHAVWETAPEKFYEWHRSIYGKQDNENSGWGSKDDIIALTKTIPGIDANKVSQLMESKKAEYQKDMDANKAEGSGFGVSGTPSVIIGNQLVVGAQPLSAFTTIIDQQLK